MTASTMRWCRRHSWVSALAALWLLVTPLPAWADGVEVKGAALVASENGYYLDAEFDITLTQVLEDALNKGVPLYFLVEFELIRPRWYWVNDRIASARQEYRVSYSTLTRQYRVSIGKLYQTFDTLSDALAVLSRVRLNGVVEQNGLVAGTSYTAGVRLRLDTSQLPRPFQVSAVGSRRWTVGSEWYRWTVSP
jgi:hypothetical protein